MQFCQTHWTRLKDEVKKYRLDHLNSKSGEEAVSRLKKGMEGKSTVPDPLMEAHNMLVQRSLQFLGIYIMGEYCPLCEADKNLPNNDEGLICSEAWITTLIKYLEEEYKKEGWLNNN